MTAPPPVPPLAALATLLLGIGGAAAAAAEEETHFVDGKKLQAVVFEGPAWRQGAGYVEGSGVGNKLQTDPRLAEGDFTLRLRLHLADLNGSAAAVQFGESHFGLDGQGKTIFGNGPWFGGKVVNLASAPKFILPRKPFELEAKREGARIEFRIDHQLVAAADAAAGPVGRVALVPHRGTMRVFAFSIRGNLVSAVDPPAKRLAELQPKIDSAIERGVAWLLQKQMRDGSFGEFVPMYLGGQTALSVYTLMKCGVPRDHPAVQRGLAYLDTVQPAETYTTGCMLLAYEATHDPQRKPQIAELARLLLAWADESGRWSYPGEHLGNRIGPKPGAPDLSNTQFAVLGLWAAHRAGVEIPVEKWKHFVEGILACQENPVESEVPLETGRSGVTRAYVAGFTYRAKESGATGSMTCAGASALKIIQICAGAKLPKATSKQIDNAVEAALGWLRIRYNVTANPNKGDWVKYYLYGLERTCALTKTETLAGHDWYFEGAEHLVAKQDPKGSWTDYYTEPDTCFALLFLKRATASVLTGRGLEGSSPELHTSEDRADAVLFRAAGGARLTMWITGFGEGAEGARGEPGPDGARPGIRVVSVEYLVNNQAVATVAGNPKKTWSTERYAATHAFGKRGEYRVTARVTVVDPGAPPGEAAPVRTLFAKGFTVNVAAVLEPWMLEAARLRERNVLRGKEYSIAGSSQLSEGEGIARAADGIESSRWLCDTKDGSPTISVELAQPVRADAVILSPCCNRDESRGIFDRIREVEIRVNKDKQTILATMPEDEAVPLVVPLPKATAVKQLEVRIVKRERGGGVPGATGWSEIGLELRAKETK